MDQIQKVLVEQGRKDLAQEYYKKTASKKQASMFKFQNGLTQVSKTYSGLLVPMAQYVLTRAMKENPPKIASGGKFSSKISLIDVQTDVGKTQPAIDGITAIYDDKIITAAMQYGEFVVTAFCSDREAAKQWQDQFEYKLTMENQYRGKNLYAENNSMFFKDIPNVGWEDVVLNDKVKRDIRMNTVAFLGDEKMSNLGVNKRGLVMFGPPGTGKTSVVKAIFRELAGKGVSRIYVTAESFRRMAVGNMFDMLSYLGPTVLAFEDIDMVGTSRDIHVGSNLLGDLLTNLDGMRSHRDPLVVMASTNKISMLDEALANRPCRFDRKIEVGLPGPDILKKIYLKNIGADVSDEVIKLSDKFTGSHVVETVNTAKILGASDGRTPIECLVEACNIIRENFFPGQTQEQAKTAASRVLVKKGYKVPGFQKKASKTSIDRIADSILNG